MSTTGGIPNFRIAQTYQQAIQNVVNKSQDPSQKLTSSEKTAAQQKNPNWESFKARASDLVKGAPAGLLIGSGAALTTVGVVGAVVLAPLTILGGLAGVGAIVATKLAKGNQANTDKLAIASLTIGTLALAGVKLMKMGIDKKGEKGSDVENKTPETPARSDVKEVKQTGTSETGTREKLTKAVDTARVALREKIEEHKNDSSAHTTLAINSMVADLSARDIGSIKGELGDELSNSLIQELNIQGNLSIRESELKEMNERNNSKNISADKKVGLEDDIKLLEKNIASHKELLDGIRAGNNEALNRLPA